MKNSVIKIRKEILDLENKFAKIQDKCIHKLKEIRYGGNTGNYDPTCDSYWVDYYCLDCCKKWREHYDKELGIYK